MLEQADRRQRIRKALQYAREHGVKAKSTHKWVVEQGWDDIGWQVIDNGLRGDLKWLHERCDYEILTDLEGQRLEEWYIASAKNACVAKEQRHCGAKEVSAKAVQLLKESLAEYMHVEKNATHYI